MEPKNFQEIFGIVEDHLPNKWEKFALYIAFVGNMSSHKFFVDSGKGYISCFDLGYEKATLREIFMSIEDILIEEREKLPKKKRWSVFTLLVDSNGEFEANYSYDDISDTFTEYQRNWEKKLINK